MADSASRTKSLETEYQLKQDKFIFICRKFGSPEIDLFASKLNTKCKIFVSWGPDPESSYVDAFTIKWSNFFYAFPPFSLISKTLNKIIEDQATGIVVVPNWSSQNWYPLFNKLLIDNPIYLKPEPDLLLSPFRTPHPLHRTLTLVTGKLSGCQY